MAHLVWPDPDVWRESNCPGEPVDASASLSIAMLRAVWKYRSSDASHLSGTRRSDLLGATLTQPGKDTHAMVPAMCINCGPLGAALVCSIRL
jgi:hypothetical protein